MTARAAAGEAGAFQALVAAMEGGPRVVAGAGRLAALGAELSGLAGGRRRTLLLADRALVGLGHVAAAAAALEAAGHQVLVAADIAGEPKEAEVAAAGRRAREDGIEAVVCLGGGSALDAGKLVAALLHCDRPVSDFRLAALPLEDRCVPLVCVPTTAGTGSEMTAVSIAADAGGRKFWYWGRPLQADLALLDPELTQALPPGVTAMTGLDALVHAIEAATNRNAGPASDEAALAAIDLIVRHLPAAVRRPQDRAARAAMLAAAALAGQAIAAAGTALAHNIGHALGSVASVPHGAAVSLAMAATGAWAVEGDPDGFARVAKAMGLPADGRLVPEAFRRLAEEIGLPLDPAVLAPGATPERLAAAMAAPENAAMRASTLRPVGDGDLLPLARLTLGPAEGRP